MLRLGVAYEEVILDRLRLAVDRGAQGTFDGADWLAGNIHPFSLGEDAGRLEALRTEPRFKGATLRITRNGIVGPWRETRVWPLGPAVA